MGSPFDDAKRILTGEKIKIDNYFMINKILSFHPNSFLLSAKHNEFIGRVPNELSEHIFHCVKRSNNPYIKYIKKRELQEPLLTKKVCKAFNVNEYHAGQIIDLLRRYKKNPEESFGLKKGE